MANNGKLVFFRTNGLFILSVFDSGRKICGFPDESHELPKVWPGYVPYDEYDNIPKSHSLSPQRALKYFRHTRRDKRRSADCHQWDISRRDHGSIRKVDEENIEYWENKTMLDEAASDMFAKIQHYHFRRRDLDNYSENTGFSRECLSIAA